MAQETVPRLGWEPGGFGASRPGFDRFRATDYPSPMSDKPPQGGYLTVRHTDDTAPTVTSDVKRTGARLNKMAARRSAASHSPSLLHDLARESRHRLRIVAGGVTWLIALLLVISVVQFEDTQWPSRVAPWQITPPFIMGIICSGATYLVLRLDVLREHTLDLALAYLIAMAGTIAYANINGYDLGDDKELQGGSWVPLFIIAYSAIVPSTRWRTFIAAVGAALLEPVAFGCYLALDGTLDTAGFSWLHWLESYFAVAIAVLLAHSMASLRDKVEEARAMGSYYLEECIGRGGMGEVWRARHNMLRRPAAVKIIRRDAIDAGAGEALRETLERFEREAQATAMLGSPHTIEIFDFGSSWDGTFYYVMELLEGYDLATLVRRFGPLPPGRVVSLLAQACHSLEDAHEMDVIHRDIKPSNIFLCEKQGQEYDFIKVLDFGLVESRSMDLSAISRTGKSDRLMGTPSFMAPEQSTGATELDRRVDIYALGCVAYWLLTGTRVFGNADAMTTISKHRNEQPVPPSRRVATPVPVELDALIIRCLAKEPFDRPQSARELADMLERIPVAEPWTPERAAAWWRDQRAGSRRDNGHGSPLTPQLR